MSKTIITQKDIEIKGKLENHLNSWFLKDQCDGTMRQTKTLLRKEFETEEEVTRMIKILQKFGGMCDCEILLNALFGRWREGQEVEISDEDYFDIEKYDIVQD